MILWLGIITTQGTVLNDRNIGKAENHCAKGCI